MKRIWIILLALMTVSLLPAATLSGTIKDTKTNKPLEFANIAVYEKDTETIKTGTMSGVDGTFRIFNVPDGHYYLVVTYMGYEKKQLDDIELSGKKVDVGVIRLSPAALEMDNVTVEAEKPAISYKIDKLVIDARQFITPGGSAVDILENVPLIEVDIEGDVSLRNRKDFTVMIDGRTSILNPQDALKIIPAETIENIEIMSDPSAKFDAEGGAGIINIVTRRDKRIGLAGLTSLSAGTTNLGGSALISYTDKKISTYVSIDYKFWNNSIDSYQDRYLYFADTTANYKINGTREYKRNHEGIKGGLDWSVSKNDVIGFLVDYKPRTSAVSYFKDNNINFSDPVTGTVFDTLNNFDYEMSDSRNASFNVVTDYTHTFPVKKDADQGNSKGSSIKHQIIVATSYSNNDSNDEVLTYLVDTSGDTTEGKWTNKIGPTSNIRGKIEYTRPLNNSSHIETGINANFNWKSNGINVFDYDPFTRDFNLEDQFSYQTDYDQNTLAAYAVYSAKFGKLGFQPGIRAEYTNRKITSDAIDSVFVFDALNIFPSLHLSYQLPSDIQLTGSYTRRISRPAGYQLEPFYTWVNAYEIRIGNPTLKPQITNSFSFNAMKMFGKNAISLNTNYQHTSNGFETIKTLYMNDDNVIQSTYENIRKNQFLSFWLSSNLNLFSWWRLSISGSLYYYSIEGELYGESASNQSLNYSANLNNTFTLPTKTVVRMNVRYMPKHTFIQGSFSTGVMTSLGLSQNFFKNKLTARLLVSDIFGLSHSVSEIHTPTTYIYSESYQNPSILLDLSLRINNYKRQRTISSIEGDGFDAVNTGGY